MKKGLLAVIGIAVLAGLWLMGLYNGLVGADQEVKTQWAKVETQYQRRFDLIPNLVESSKAVLKQEQAIIDSVTEARTKYSGATTVDEKAKAAGEVETALGRLLVVMENYPELKSDETVQRLMDELAGTENRIAVERGRYNDLVGGFNVRVKTFPNNVIAGMLGFSEKAFFESVEAASSAPAVNFD